MEAFATVLCFARRVLRALKGTKLKLESDY